MTWENPHEHKSPGPSKFSEQSVESTIFLILMAFIVSCVLAIIYIF